MENDVHHDVLQNIEVGLKIEYEKNDNLTDIKTIFGCGLKYRQPIC